MLNFILRSCDLFFPKIVSAMLHSHLYRDYHCLEPFGGMLLKLDAIFRY